MLHINREFVHHPADFTLLPIASGTASPAASRSSVLPSAGVSGASLTGTGGGTTLARFRRVVRARGPKQGGLGIRRRMTASHAEAKEFARWRKRQQIRFGSNTAPLEDISREPPVWRRACCTIFRASCRAAFRSCPAAMASSRSRSVTTSSSRRRKKDASPRTARSTRCLSSASAHSVGRIEMRGPTSYRSTLASPCAALRFRFGACQPSR